MTDSGPTSEAKIVFEVLSNLRNELALVEEYISTTDKVPPAIKAVAEATRAAVDSTKQGTEAIVAQTAQYKVLKTELEAYVKLAKQAAEASAVNGGSGTSAGLAAQQSTAQRDKLIATSTAAGENGIAQLKLLQAEQDRAVKDSLSGIEKVSAARTAAYTKAYEQAVKLDQAQQSGNRYATIPNASRNTATASGSAEAQAGYQQQELAAMGQYYAELERTTAAEGRADETRKKATTSLISERYALYDVATTASLVGIGMFALIRAYEQVAIARERAFADVQRTSGIDATTAAGTAALDKLKGQLDDLSRTLPKTFTEIDQIATASSQIGIKPEDLAAFTTVIAKLSTTTNVSSDAAVQSLGKLVNILHLGQSAYEGLAGSVAYAGLKSAATETQILAVANVLAPSIGLYKGTADQVVGLATAYASLGLAGDIAAGTTQRTFKNINAAVDGGGERLANFAKVSGQSVGDFKKNWETDATSTYVSFINGLGNVKNLDQTLTTLGINASRDGRTIKALAGNVDLLNESLANAKTGADGSYLNAAFAVVTDTIDAKIKELTSSIQILEGSFGQSLLPTIGAVADAFNNGAHAISVFLQNSGPIGPVISYVAGVLVVIVAAFATLVGAGALAGASILAIKTAMDAMGATATGAKLTLLQFIAGLLGMTPPAGAAVAAVEEVTVAVGAMGAEMIALPGATAAADGGLLSTAAAADVATAGMGAATIGANILKVALISTGIGAAVVILGSIIGAIVSFSDGQAAATTAADKTSVALKAQNDLLLANAKALEGNVKASNDFVTNEAAMEASLYALGQALQKNGQDFTTLSVGGRANIKALTDAIAAMAKQANGSPTDLANSLQALRNQLVSVGAGADALQIVDNALVATGASVFKVTELSNSLVTGLNDVSTAAVGAADALATTADYANQLSGIFTRSFEIRFGADQGLDAISSKFQSMQDTSTAAKLSVTDLTNQILVLQAAQGTLSADRSVDEYFLRVANQFGDQVRAKELQAQIAKIDADTAKNNSDIATKTTDLSKAQDTATNSLTGNSSAAITARANVLGLVTSYQDYLQKLAASGLSQDGLKQKSGELRNEFINQLTQMGFNRDEVEKYAKSFDDMGTIIATIPRNVTVTAWADPAQQAINEFLAKNSHLAVEVTIAPNLAQAAAAGQNMAQVYANALADALRNPNAPGPWKNGYVFPTAPPSGSYSTQPNPFFGGSNNGAKDNYGFSSGGATVTGADTDVAGYVHANEFVFSAPAVRKIGVANLAFEHQRALGGYADGGYTGGSGSTTGGVGIGGGGIMQLSPTDRALLASIANRPVTLILPDGRQIAAVVQSGNVTSSRSV